MELVTEAQTNLKKRNLSWRGLTPARRREALWGLFFISPWLIGFILFYLFPMIASLIFTTYDFQLYAPDEANFLGLSNWTRMLTDDPLVWEALAVTFRFAFINLPIGMVSAFALALLLNSKHLFGRNVLRTLYYAPTMVPLIASILIWNQVLNTQQGWINKGIEWLTGYEATSVEGLRWLDDPRLIYLTYTMIGIWGIGNSVLINLAALQGVPSELFDAARVDGAGWFRRLWSVTLPMVSPVIFYNLVLGIIGLLQYFIVPWVLNGGDGYPDGTTRFFMIYFFKQAFTFTNMGYGAALAWLLFIVALILTVVLFGTARYWVYYSGDTQE